MDKKSMHGNHHEQSKHGKQEAPGRNPSSAHSGKAGSGESKSGSHGTHKGKK